MFRSSMIADGPRGLADLFARPVDDEVEDIKVFGIDWDVVDDATYMDHLRRHNPDEWDATNPFSAAPPKMAHVPVDPPECPFNRESMDILAAALGQTSGPYVETDGCASPGMVGGHEFVQLLVEDSKCRLGRRYLLMSLCIEFIVPTVIQDWPH